MGLRLSVFPELHPHSTGQTIEPETRGVQPGALAHRELLLLDIAGPGLGLEQQPSAGSQAEEHPPEEPPYAGVAEVEVDPLGDAETEHGVELRLHRVQQGVRLQHKVGLPRRRRWCYEGWTWLTAMGTMSTRYVMTFPVP